LNKIIINFGRILDREIRIMVFMKKWFSILLFSIFTIHLQAQKDSLSYKRYSGDVSNIVINIYPVPVKDNRFTIKCNTDISAIKITNIIGQDIYRAQYKNPQPVTDILLLNNQKRGMYLVTIIFKDGRRVVKKILIEESD